MAAGNDVLSGMSRKNITKSCCTRISRRGVWGERAQRAGLFNREEREVVLSGLLRQYETGSSLDIFKDMVEDLVDESIVYQSNDSFYEILVFIGQKKTETAQGRMAPADPPVCGTSLPCGIVL